MHPLSLLIVFVAFWALANFWLIPLLHAGWTAGDIVRKVNRAATLTLLEKARDLACVGAITMTLLVACFGVIALLGEGSAAWSKSAIDTLSSAYRLLEGFATDYAQLVLWFGMLAGAVALYVAAKTAKRKVVQAWHAEAHRIRTEFLEDPEALESLRRDPAYQTQFERLDKIQALLRDQAAGLSPDERSGATREVDQLLDELAAERSRDTFDLDRALSADAAPRATADRPYKRLQRLATILVGPRLSADLGLVSKYLTLLLVALLLTALTGWSAAPLANSFRVTVNELRVFALIDDVDREVQDAIARIESPTDQEKVEPQSVYEGAETLSRASRLVAQAAINQIHTSGLLDPERVGQTRVSRAEFVRAAILNRPLAADVPESVATRMRQEVAQGFRDTGRPPVANKQLVTHFTRQADDILRDVQARNPRALDRVVDRIVRRYGTSLNPLGVQGSLISKTVSASLGLADVNVSNDLAKVAKTLVSDVGKKAIGEWANAHVKAIVTDGLLGTHAKAEVVERLARGDNIQRPQRISQLINNLQLARGTGWGPSPAEALSDNVSKAVANAVARRYDPRRGQATVQRGLAGYSEVFPRPGAAAGQMTDVSAFATDFTRATRSSRVRGVIFGRDFRPEFRVTDLAWELDTTAGKPASLSFRVFLDDAEESFGPFLAGVVNQALRYAADQRVVATTITPGDGKVIRRVTYLHPTLEDTPLGCRIVEIDRVIDEFTRLRPIDSVRSSRLHQQLTDISSHRAAAWRFIQVAEVAASSRPRCKPLSLRLDQSETPPPAAMASHLDSVRQLFSGLDDTMHSIALVETALTCSASQAATIGECLCDAAADVDLSKPYWFPEDHTSQVREQAVTGVHDFDSLFRAAMTSENIDLWLHTTFAVRKYGKPLGDEPETIALDFPPEQIELLNRLLVPQGIAAYAKDTLRIADYEDFMMPIAQFVLIQRFMRTALSGGFDQAFPIEKLIELERATAPYVPVQRTTRWEFRDAYEEFPSVLFESGDEAIAAFSEWYDDDLRREFYSLPACDPAAS